MSEQTIYLTALQKAEAERSAYLDAACDGDLALRQRVEKLLDAQAGAGSDGEASAALTAAGPSPRGEAAPTEAEPILAAEGDAALSFLAPSRRPGALGRLGHYEILEVVGKGGFGIVLKAFDERLHRVVAVKVLGPQLSASGAARMRFLREARAAAAVRDDHVIDVHDVEETPIPYLVMEYVAGQTLQDKLDKKGPLELAEVLRIGCQAAHGLAAAHAQGLIHRDVKPANILLDNGVERVKISDFGLARAVDDASLTQSGVVAGTPMYMAPEQAEGQPLDHRADLFSLGSVLYAMCTGRPPFRAAGAMAVLRRVVDDQPHPIRDLNKDIPEWLCAVIARLHAKAPADRFQSALEVADVLARGLAALQAGEPAPSPPAAPRRFTGRRLIAAAGVAVLLSLAAFSVYRLTAPGPDRSGPAPHTAPTADRLPPAFAVAPFDGDQARRLQQAWADYLGVPAEVTNPVGMKMRLIPPGEFLMGLAREEVPVGVEQSPDAFLRQSFLTAGPPRRAVLAAAYYCAATETTVGQFRQFVEATGYRTEAETDGKGGRVRKDGRAVDDPQYTWKTPGYAATDDLPVTQLTGKDFAAFSNWLSGGEGLPLAYADPMVPGPPAREATGYRLPTEAEWEFACRAGTTTPFSFGAADLALVQQNAWVPENAGGQPRPVAGKPPNAFGLFDMHGNVSEACHPGLPGLDGLPMPAEKGGADLAVRGGTWDYGWYGAYSSFRGRAPSTNRGWADGFRVVRAVPPPPGAARPTPSAPATPLKDALLVMTFDKDAFYERDGRTCVRDLSGHDNDGCCEKATYTPDGRAGGGLACDGGFLRLPRSFINRAPEYTITAWVRVAEDDDQAGAIYRSASENKPDVEFTYEFVYLSNNGVFVNAWNAAFLPDDWKAAASQQPLFRRGKWCFVAVVLKNGGVDRGDLRATIDDQTLTLHSQMVDTPGQVVDYLGRMKGVLDEVAVFGRALSDSEIAEIRRRGLRGRPLVEPADAGP